MACEVIVVGAGVVGLSTACALAERGCRVTVLERGTVGHEWSSSRGPSRAIRHEYGRDRIYSEMVARSLTLWEDLEKVTGRDLYTRTGVLTLGREDDDHTLSGLATMQALGLPAQRLDHDQCRARFPQFVTGDYDAITYNESGGFLAATQSLVALAERASDLGVRLAEGAAVNAIKANGSRPGVGLNDWGTTLLADRIVVTAGAATADLLADLNLPIRATRQQVCYLDGLPAAPFAVGAFPVFLAGMKYYGFPAHGHAFFKVASHTPGEEVRPGTPYAVDQAEIEGCVDFLRRVIPMAAEGRVVGDDRCAYDMTPDEDFILDLHPANPSVVLGCGFSGHGFKFGVLTGRLLASLTLGEEPEFPLDRFRVSRFSAN